MKLYLIRHAHAVAAEEDPRRPLSRKGRAQVRQLVRCFRGKGAIDVAEMWHSPLVRSIETATLLARGLRLGVPLLQVPGIEPEHSVAPIARRIAAAENNLAVVGHEPHLSALASRLLGGKAAPALVKLRKGACLALERKDRTWRICWLVAPGLLAG